MCVEWGGMLNRNKHCIIDHRDHRASTVTREDARVGSSNEGMWVEPGNKKDNRFPGIILQVSQEPAGDRGVDM